MMNVQFCNNCNFLLIKIKERVVLIKISVILTHLNSIGPPILVNNHFLLEFFQFRYTVTFHLLIFTLSELNCILIRSLPLVYSKNYIGYN